LYRHFGRGANVGRNRFIAPPHFRAIYAEHEAFVAIETGEAIGGTLPKPAARLVKGWALARQEQLRENWRRARLGERSVQRFRSSNHMPRHSGARPSAEGRGSKNPESSNLDRWLWIPGSPPLRFGAPE
jgi:hypothetical protein